ncbi:hypothetical protein B1756_09680 [Natrarchaeobaculum aegyptiacum]|uniref:Glycosyltransferase subfamily 4-like N-terminal domain-containing protein n=1 Tax=Natrarchaeobaculum aegyptiacum TaxID=745377 RepID=A0A2Z2I3C9_9EURY|nr:hypothetical protein B1756_09680 [Natrarchaeobaculum aegyptiacum]
MVSSSHARTDDTGDDPNVLVVSQKYPPENGGNAARIGDLTRHMTEDADVTVLAPPPCYPPTAFEWSWKRARTETRDGVRVHRLWAVQLRGTDPSFLERMAYYLTFAVHACLWLCWHRREFDVVVTTSPPIFTGFGAFPVHLLGSITWVVDIRDLWIDVSADLGFIDDDGLAARLSRRYRELELRRADLLTVTSPGTTEQLREQYDFETPVSLVPNGVDTRRFRPAGDVAVDREASDRRRSTHTHPEVATSGSGASQAPTEVDLIYTGNLGYAQDLETCIRALSHTERAVTLRIVGDGDRRDALEELAVEVGVDEQVEFTGLVDRETVPDLLTDARIGLAPLEDRESLSYAVPTKLYEYMACGLPVLATGRGQIERHVDDSGAGVVAADDPAAVAAVIDDLLDDEQVRREYGRRGREFVTDQYDRRAIARSFAADLDRLSST